MATDPDSSSERYRRAGRELADRLADFLAARRSRPPSPDVRPGIVAAAQPPAPGEEPQPLAAIVEEFWSDVLPASVVWNHPRFFTWFNSSASPAGIVAETVAAALDTNTMSWDSGRGLTELEQVATRWVAHLLGLERTHEGLILDVVVFRYRGTEAENREMEAAVNAAGEVLIGHTEVGGRFALRAVVGHLETDLDDIRVLWLAVSEAVPS